MIRAQEIALAIIIFVLCGTAALAHEDALSCIEASSGAREGEPLDARIARLELQLRLSKAERMVNRSRR